MEEKENNKITDADILASAFRASLKGIDSKLLGELCKCSAKLDDKVLNFIMNVNSNEEIKILINLLQQNIQLIDDLMKRGENNNG